MSEGLFEKFAPLDVGTITGVNWQVNPINFGSASSTVASAIAASSGPTSGSPPTSSPATSPALSTSGPTYTIAVQPIATSTPKQNIAVIAGATCGSAVLVLLIALAFVFERRRGRQKQSGPNMTSIHPRPSIFGGLGTLPIDATPTPWEASNESTGPNRNSHMQVSQSLQAAPKRSAAMPSSSRTALDAQMPRQGPTKGSRSMSRLQTDAVPAAASSAQPAQANETAQHLPVPVQEADTESEPPPYTEM